MKGVAAFLCMLLVVAHGYTELEYKTTFSDWMLKHNRVYESSVFQHKYSTFKNNMDFVKEWNADTSHTHTVELNAFADLTVEEYKNIYLGTRIDATERLANAGPHVNYTIPQDYVNWVSKGAVTYVKDQGQCGSCWAFSTTGSVEGVSFLYGRGLNPLSEQNLVDCSGGYGNQGCNGGWMDNAFRYIIANGGIDLESAYPYQATNGPCRYNAANNGAQIIGYQDLQSGNEYGLTSQLGYLPVSVAIDAGHQSFQLYKGGVYYEAACSASSLDHGVLAVGYGSDSGDYFIVKNSWGAGWGESGYIRMSRFKNNNCGIATAATFPKKS